MVSPGVTLTCSVEKLLVPLSSLQPIELSAPQVPRYSSSTVSTKGDPVNALVCTFSWLMPVGIVMRNHTSLPLLDAPQLVGPTVDGVAFTVVLATGLQVAVTDKAVALLQLSPAAVAPDTVRR